MEKIQVSFLLTSTGWGGLELNVINLAEALIGMGVEINLITQEESTIYKNRKTLFRECLFVNRNRKYFDFQSAQLIANFISDNKHNVLLVFDNRDLDMAAIAKRKYNSSIRIIYFQQMQIGINKKGLIHTRRFKQIDIWITPLTYLKEELGLRTKFNLSNVQILPIGIDSSKFNQEQYTKLSCREKLQMDVDSFYFGIIGRIDRKKGQLITLQAFYEFQKNHSNCKLLIFGSPTINDPDSELYFNEIKEFIKVKELGHLIEFAPFQPEVQLFYRSVDCFIMASESETYGMVTVESLASGTPTIGADTGGTPDLLGRGEFGPIFSYPNIQDLAAKMELLYADYEVYKKKANAGQQYVTENYTLKKEAEGFFKNIKALNCF